jgi:hypothetical protein
MSTKCPYNCISNFVSFHKVKGKIMVLFLSNYKKPHRWCLNLIVMVGFECSRDPESYAGGSAAAGRGTHAGKVKV